MTVVYRGGTRLVSSRGGLTGDFGGRGLNVYMECEQLQPGDLIIIERRLLGIAWSVREFEVTKSVPAGERIIDYAIDLDDAAEFLALVEHSGKSGSFQ